MLQLRSAYTHLCSLHRVLPRARVLDDAAVCAEGRVQRVLRVMSSRYQPSIANSLPVSGAPGILVTTVTSSDAHALWILLLHYHA